MYYLIDRDEDSSVLVRADSELIVDREPEIGEIVRFMWKGKVSGGKTMEYSGRVVAKSDNKQEILELEKKYITEQTLSPKDIKLGKGLRTKIPKVFSSDSEDGEEGEETKPKKKNVKEAKKLEELKTAKLIARKLKFTASLPTRSSPRKIQSNTSPEKSQPVQPSTSNVKVVAQGLTQKCHECEKKDKEIDRQRRVVKKLRKERDEAIELSRWLGDVKDMANILRQPASSALIKKQQPLAEKKETAESENISETIDDGDDLMPYQPAFEPHNEPLEDQREEHDGQINESTQFKYKRSDEGVTKLIDTYNVFIHRAVKQRILSFSKTHAQLARNAMEAVFKEEALKTCSLQGKRSTTNRKGLDMTGFAAVLDFAEHFAREKSMKVEDPSYVKKQLSTRLCELRKIPKTK